MGCLQRADYGVGSKIGIEEFVWKLIARNSCLLSWI